MNELLEFVLFVALFILLVNLIDNPQHVAEQFGLFIKVLKSNAQ